MSDHNPITSPGNVLDFWFGAPGSPEFGAPRPAWFRQSDDFDAEIKTRFGQAVEAALTDGLEDWRQDIDGRLALILLLDQFPRNIFRGTAKMFAGDPRARSVAAKAIAAGADKTLLPVQQTFLYLPFEHSEDAQDQAYSVQLFEAMPDDVAEKANWLDYAIRHKAIIDRFARFPHRNEVLGRLSTPQEVEFLQEPDSGF